ncbi:MAG: prepilin-type N-terminal cleavage/methylation domain-containing protein [Myxococcota bacterium]
MVPSEARRAEIEIAAETHSRSFKSDSQRVHGVTLIEILVVILLLSLAVSGSALGLGALTRSSLRKSCFTVVAAARFAYARAVTQGKTIRIVLDFETQNISIEEAEGHVVLARSDDEIRQELDEDEEDLAAVDPWAVAEARLEEAFTPSFGASPFQPMRGPSGEVLKRYKPRAIGDHIRFARLITPHEIEPREYGKGSIYFFPQGRTERAIVQLSDRGGSIFSIEIHPLTGRGTVYPYAFEPEALIDSAALEDPG